MIVGGVMTPGVMVVIAAPDAIIRVVEEVMAGEITTRGIVRAEIIGIEIRTRDQVIGEIIIGIVATVINNGRSSTPILNRNSPIRHSRPNRLHRSINPRKMSR